MKNSSNSLLMEVIHEIKDRRPHIKDILCEAILLEIETQMERAYEEGLREGRAQAATETWTRVPDKRRA